MPEAYPPREMTRQLFINESAYFTVSSPFFLRWFGPAPRDAILLNCARRPDAVSLLACFFFSLRNTRPWRLSRSG